ncbi:hypothetical protein LOC67_26465 [Stieleria sp. JC731]|uniref:hypothetical protein n=1 Tax=Pirellulaceae TaxID=2691357 RepID=UPI001E2B3E76|nr:hypothetical protein [Stieleria sp. JC731]MCC9604113.1 hypothetical protein [Stieleria sp. JC731]
MSTSDQPKLNSHDDADPVIDALLMEFISGDAKRRLQPPDLSDAILAKLSSDDVVSRDVENATEDSSDSDRVSMLPLPNPGSGRRRLGVDGQPLPPPVHSQQPSSSDDAKAIDDSDPVVDVLLKEFIALDPNKRTTPPDLSESILARLNDSAVVPARNHQPSYRYGLVKTLSAVAAFAASILGVIYLGPFTNKAIAPKDAEVSSLVGSPSPNVTDSSPEIPMLADYDVDDRQPIEPRPGVNPGIRLDLPESNLTDSDLISDANSLATGDTDTSDLNTTALPSDRVVVGHIELMATTTESIAREYWKSVGVQPTPRASDAELAARLQQRLGIQLPTDAMADPQRLRDEFAKSNHAREIAKRWLALSADWNLGAIDNEQNQPLLDELTEGVSGQVPMDVTLVGLISGESQHSGQWYQVIGRDGTEGIARRLAGISMNADLRCVRCHDSMIGRSGTQDDYWSFVAMIRSFVHRDNDHWSVQSVGKPVPTFFELLDGRQRLAVPKVSEHLAGKKPMDDFHAWSETLKGSQQLAASIVDSLWKLVHGRPLQPSPVDALAPPVDDHLNRLHQQLARDLQESNFDLARTLSLIVSSPMSTRSVPQQLRGDALLTTSDKDRSQALELVTAFAAAVDAPASSRHDRIEVAMRRVGGRLVDDGTLLAQPVLVSPTSREVANANKPKLSREDKISVDFPGEDASLPVSWIQSIDDFDQQVQHLVYLSGGRRVPENVTEAAKRLRQNSDDDAALSRIWWILR